jgi:hypothetical protein
MQLTASAWLKTMEKLAYLAYAEEKKHTPAEMAGVSLNIVNQSSASAYNHVSVWLA